MSANKYTEHEKFANKAGDYLQQHRLFDLFSGLLEKLSIYQPADPLSFLIQHLGAGQAVDSLRMAVTAPPSADTTALIAHVTATMGLVQISARQLMADEIANKTTNGIKAAQYKERNAAAVGADSAATAAAALPGAPVSTEYPTDIIVSMLLDRTARSDCMQRGWVLTDFPRTRPEAQRLQMSGVLVNRFVNCTTDEASPATTSSEAVLAYRRSVLPMLEMYRDVLCDVDVSNYDGSGDGARFGEITTQLKSALRSSAVSYEPKRPLRVLLLAPPGAAKQAICNVVCNQQRLVHVCVGNLLRDLSRPSLFNKDEANGATAAEFMSRGQLVPDDIVLPLVRARLLQQDCRRRGFVLEGFPRTVAQAKLLEDMNIVPNRVVFLNVDDATAVTRRTSRRVDPVTGDVYVVDKFAPSSTVVASRLEHQPQDRADAVAAMRIAYMTCVGELQTLYADSARTFDAGAGSQQQLVDDVTDFLRTMS